MSTEEHKASLQRAARHFSNPETRAAYLDLYDANAVVHGYQGVEPGIASITKFYQALWAAFPDCVLTLDDVIAEGDKVACRFLMQATHLGEFQGLPPTGKRVSLSGITILRFADGKCVERWSQADFLGMLQQLGAIPASGQPGA